jgi:hypothetical protein
LHHVNGRRDDDRIENLQPITHIEHARLHASLRERDGTGVFA